MESLQACGPAIRRAALASRARAPAARFQAADCPAESPAAARWVCPALMAESRAARSALHRDLAVVAEIGPRVRHRRGCHLHIGDYGAGRVPELGIVGRDLEHADVGIFRRVPPRLGRRREQLLDLRTVVGDDGGTRQRDVFLAACIRERQVDGRIARDLLVLVTPRVGEEIYRVRVAIEIGAHRPRAELVSIARHQHRKSDRLHQIPYAIDVAGIVVGHVVLLLARDDNGARGTRFRPEDGTYLFRRVANRLDVVAVRVEHEGAVIGRVIMRPNAGRPVVAPARRDRRLVELVHRGAVLCQDRDMHRLVQRALAADPEIRLAVGAEAGGRIVSGLLLRDLHDQAVAERGQCLGVERLGALIVGDRESHMVDHRNLVVRRQRDRNVLLRVLRATTKPRATMSAIQSSRHSLCDKCSITTAPGHSDCGASRKKPISTRSSNPSTSIFNASTLVTPASSRMRVNRSEGTLIASVLAVPVTTCVAPRLPPPLSIISSPSLSPAAACTRRTWVAFDAAWLNESRSNVIGCGSTATTFPDGPTCRAITSAKVPTLAPTSTNTPPAGVCWRRKSSSSRLYSGLNSAPRSVALPW